jgi:hypothetical protein
MKKMILTLAVMITISTAAFTQTKYHKQVSPLALTESIVNGDYKFAKKCKHEVKHKEFKADTCLIQKLTESVRYNPDEFMKQDMEKEQKEITNALN